jgi:rhodanese-related sulfurtransferase
MFENLTSPEFRERIQNDENAVIIDVRTPEEWAEGVIPGALLINLMSPDFMEKINELDKSKTYYVYCRSGGRSSSACGAMAQSGYTCVNLLGGMMAWDGEVVEPQM